MPSSDSKKIAAAAAIQQDLLARLRRLTEQTEVQRIQAEAEEAAAAAREAEQDAAEAQERAEAQAAWQAQAALQAQAPRSAAVPPPKDLSERDAAVTQVRALMAELDVTVVDILASIGRLDPSLAAARNLRAMGKPVGAPVTTNTRRRTMPYQDVPNAPIRYRHPDSGETWTGIGRAPAWIRESEMRGISRDQFLLD